MRSASSSSASGRASALAAGRDVDARFRVGPGYQDLAAGIIDDANIEGADADTAEASPRRVIRIHAMGTHKFPSQGVFDAA
jgi:hypothetical protein